jgi:uncharacterized protein (DUF58 family)
LARSGERIAWPGVTAPFASRNGAEQLATRLIHASGLDDHPDFSTMRHHSDLIIASDFLDPIEDMVARLGPLAGRGVRAHLIEIADPVEEQFPYAGRTEFIDPETSEKITAGRAEILAAEYQSAYRARREELSDWCKRLGWSFTVNHTDKLASEALVHVYMQLSGVAGLRHGAPG